MIPVSIVIGRLTCRNTKCGNYTNHTHCNTDCIHIGIMNECSFIYNVDHRSNNDCRNHRHAHSDTKDISRSIMTRRKFKACGINAENYRKGFVYGGRNDQTRDHTTNYSVDIWNWKHCNLICHNQCRLSNDK